MPGRTGAAKIFLATVEIPEAALADLSPEFSYEILKRFTALDKKIFHYTLAAAPHFILMRDSENINSVFYFTDGSVSERYGDFQQRWFVDDYAEASRINAPELIIDENAPVTDDELSQKIAANKVFRKELKYIIRQSNWSNLTAFKFNFYYIPTHYSIKMSPLRFIDVPKIRTITTYGDRIVLSNSAFITTIAELRVELDRLLLDSVNRRIKHYTELQTASRLSGGTTRTRDSKARPRVYRGHAHHCQQVKGIDIIKKA